MIYTVTLNPSIDFIVRLDHVEAGAVNRMTSDDKYAGGKGINVSRILQRLNIANIATGYIGGFTGAFIEDVLREEGIATTFVRVEEDTRINVKIKADQETEINGTGPYISEAKVQELLDLLEQLTADDVVVFAGSAPANLGNQIYNRLIPLVKERGAEVVCDFEGQTLLDSLAYEPLLVKPNNHELEAIFGVELNSLDDVAYYGRQILDKGAKNVIVSMAGDGALFITPEETYFAKPIKGQVKNSVGAGDSMVAGFTGSLVRTGDPIEALKWGVACGTATAFSDDLADSDFINQLYQQVEVEIR
ncbi:1-phosphofructokinase [Streptococcus rupicaprae]|uniref:Tagatose-6-phosphate kinase n=1 Tax=Streptococcus rupicaprae TaxID=759619 RepID=A0ABV2FJM9_9STRE